MNTKTIVLNILLVGLWPLAIIGMPGKLFVVYGPSGVGKTTLMQAVTQSLSSEYAITQIITYTTRLPRSGEQNGIDYHFISPDEFKTKKNNHFFIHTTELLTASYGLQRSLFKELNAGKNFIVSLDRQGAQKLSQLLDSTVLLWVEAPVHELLSRMRKRNRDTQEQILKRFALAEREIEHEHNHGIYDYHIINTDFELALAYMLKVIKAELNFPVVRHSTRDKELL